MKGKPKQIVKIPQFDIKVLQLVACLDKSFLMIMSVPYRIL